jgi:hypothetical protein
MITSWRQPSALLLCQGSLADLGFTQDQAD